MWPQDLRYSMIYLNAAAIAAYFLIGVGRTRISLRL